MLTKNLTEEDAWGLRSYPDGIPENEPVPKTYLHVMENRSEHEWILPVRPRQTLDLTARVKDWVSQVCEGDAHLCGKITLSMNIGDFYGKLVTDGRPPHSGVVWMGGGFHVDAY